MGNKISRRIIKRKKSTRTNSSRESSTISSRASSSNLQLTPQLRTVAGRPYFDESFSSYIYPADWEEADRIQALHFVLKHIFNGNYSQEFPEADVYGIDIMSSFPNQIKPNNCYFQTCDILEGLPFDDNEFDYVFMRHMNVSIKKDQWLPVLKDIKRVMKPGGVIESVELNCFPYSTGPVQTQFMNKMNEAMIEVLDMDLQFKLEPMFKDLEFQNVTSITPVMNLTEDEWDRLQKIMYFEEIDKYHSYQEHYIVLATKDS
ncbi:9586_t:CDS:2 [Dentiscutata erythropus]|uniref:9586_t:CDS:1 n=1 Tax=Dentiscutata erythropus TaxID=1348616 RepID=A0A9N9C7F0_9GLOM|nr:9586_t:CDS:2 [Dentiscutata erythropus]